MGRLCKVVLWCLLATLCVSAFGCNTVEGLSRDMQKAGEAIQNAFD
jgi:predicted small secreted protein